ncbi:MAG: hypothetical protein WBA77_17145 [Microcoleaceae cyanobacterium]
MMSLSRETRFNIVILISCFLLSCLSYFNIINSFFLADDFNWVYQIKTRGAFGVWTTAPDVFFRPVVSLTFFLDYTIWGLNSIGYHLTNLSFHAICGFFIYRILSQLLNQVQLPSKQIKITALIAALLFIILPSHVEAVTWISARSDLVAACFCLASFSYYLFYKNTQYKSRLILSYFLFLLALLSKESVIIYPGIIFCYEIYDYLNKFNESKKTIKNIILLPLIYTSLFPIYLILRYFGLGQIIGGYGTGVHLQYSSDIILRGLASTLRVLISPIPNSNNSDWQLFFLCTIITLLIIMLAYAWRGGYYQKISKLLLFLITIFLTSLIPIINLVVSLQDNQGERFLYFPSVFMIIVFTILVSTLLWRYQLLLLLYLTIIVILFSYTLYHSNQNWRIASQISQQIIEDINSITTDNSLFIINIPDNFNGAYIYRNGLYPATQLFCEDKNIKYLPLVLFNNVIHIDDKVKVTALSENQYNAQLMQPQTYFLNPMIPIEQRLETPNFKIIDFDWNSRQSFKVEVKNPAFVDDVVYYSGGHIMKAKSSR